MTAPDPAPAAPPADAGRVMILSADLLTGTPLVAAVRAAGFAPRRVLSIGKADPKGCVAVLLDLSFKGGADWLAALSADAPPVLAFGPHVHAEKLRAARAAGRGPVLARSQLSAGVPAWLDSLRKDGAGDADG